MKTEIKKILLDLIYTPDAKPRFVGGDLDEKLQRIDNAVDKIANLTKPSSFDKAHEYLTQSDEETDLPVEAQVLAIVNQSKIDDTEIIDNIDGVQTVQVFEYAFTCKDFLNQISW